MRSMRSLIEAIRDCKSCTTAGELNDNWINKQFNIRKMR